MSRLPVFTGTPGGIRTPDPRLRRPLLYPTELLARGFFRRHCIPGTGRKGKGYAGRRPLAARAKQVEDRDVRRTIRHRPGSGRPGRPVPEGWGEKQKGQGRGGPAPDEAATGCSAQVRRRRPTAANPARPVAKRTRVAGSGTGTIALSVSARKVKVAVDATWPKELAPKSMVR